jgi:hypothetical protein
MASRRLNFAHIPLQDRYLTLSHFNECEKFKERRQWTTMSPGDFKSEIGIMSIHYLEELYMVLEDGISLNIRWNDARFVVHLNRSSVTTSVENTFIERYTKAREHDGLGVAEDLSNEILDAVVEYGRPLFDAIVPPPASRSSLPRDLHTVLFPREHNFFSRTMNKEIEVVHFNKHNGETPILVGQTGQPFHLNTAEGFNLPSFSTKEMFSVT